MARARAKGIPDLPQLLKDKIYKTGQTRGADDDEVYQNRVGRNGTVLIPFPQWEQCKVPSPAEPEYENGFIVLIAPALYFGDPDIAETLRAAGLELGRNALVFYERRIDWATHPPDRLGWEPGASRRPPLSGQYVARVAATTAAEGAKINRGYNATTMKGAGIRVYEYASTKTIVECRLQLEALFWFCEDAEAVALTNGMTRGDVEMRRAWCFDECRARGLLDFDRLRAARTINREGKTICPLCLLELSGQGFFERVAQAEGRAVHDLTITQLNLFHVVELRYGVLNHRPYNLGWGHHHCNVVVKDTGIAETVEWMRSVIERNDAYARSASASKSDG